MGQFSCALVGAAYFDAEHFISSAFEHVVAVDGGFAALSRIGITPMCAIGDFDSLGFVPKDVAIEKHPVMKDDSDTALALDWVRLHGESSVAVYGALGGRLDHSMATFAALVAAARQGMRVVAVGEENVVAAIAGGMELSLPAIETGTFSVFSAPDVSFGLCERGSLYEVEGVDLRNDVTLGLSNEFVGRPVQISVEEGALLVFLPKMPLADIVIQ